MLKERYIEFRANKFREEHGLATTEPVDTYKLLAKLNVIITTNRIIMTVDGIIRKLSELKK